MRRKIGRCTDILRTKQISKKKENKMKEKEYITKKELKTEYGWNDSLIFAFLSPNSANKWKKEEVEMVMESKAFQTSFPKFLERRRKRKEREEKRKEEERKREEEKKERDEIAEFLSHFDIGEMIERGKRIERRFVIHVGPTNSGKTYHAIQALKKAESGVYLGPLRLLALEMFDSLNSQGFPCNLLTGEEKECVNEAKFTASTIEMADYGKHYEVAIIDEAQLIFDPSRGGNWTKAILLLDAEEIHICVAPEGLKIISDLIDEMGHPQEIIEHERLAPLKFNGVIKNISKVKKGDALITFSRKGVLSIAAELERLGVKASVIYGALPPASRREEVRRFVAGETTVVVATDAIGLGVSLPIRRIIFCATHKYDGTDTRQLKTSEVKQIAGRAGRFGIYDEGYVVTFDDPKFIEKCLLEETESIEKLVLPFPEEVLYSEYSLIKLMLVWDLLPKIKGIERVDLSDPIFLYKHLPPVPEFISKKEIFSYICCPVDTKSDELVAYWRHCLMAIFAGKELPHPSFETYSLEGCELQYKALDVKHQLLRRLGIEDNSMEEKLELCKKINEFLKASKSNFLRRCSVCKKPLPLNYTYGMCENCYNNRRWNRYYDDDWF